MTIEQPFNYLEFNKPIQIVWRAGTPSDPFIERLDITKVVNQRISLTEIPDELFRVRIAGMLEINYDNFMKNSLSPNEFYCDYTNGFVFFHASKEANTITILYKGRGVLLYPASRIVLNEGGDIGTSLQDKLSDVNDQIQQLIQETADFQDIIDKAVVATNYANEAADIVIQTNETALENINLIQNAYETTVLIWQPYVQTYSDIAKLYPDPMVGWLVQVYDTGIRYRWNGSDWVPIDMLGGNIPLATSQYAGLMSKEDFVKLEDISENVDYRTIVFVCPKSVFFGVQDAHIEFPFDGKIIELTALVSKPGIMPTDIIIEKTADFVTWTKINNKNLLIPANSYRNDTSHTIDVDEVKKGDVFRIDIPSYDVDASNLSVNIKIKID